MSDTTDIVVSQPEFKAPAVPALATIESIKELARMAAQSGLAKTKSPYDAFFVAMYGMELGIPPMTAMRTIYSVGGGAPTCSGEAMLSLLRGSGKVRVSIPDPSTVKDSATITIKRLDTGESGSYTFTLQMAGQAGLTSRDSWKKFPHMMLIWRAVSMGAKLLCSDIIGGLYTNEEIYPDVQVDETGAIVGTIVSQPDPSPHEALPDPEPPTQAPENRCWVNVTKIQTVNDRGNRNLVCFTDAADPATFKAFTRQPFIETGWVDENELTEFGAVLDFDPPIPVHLKRNNKGYWEISRVDMPFADDEFSGDGIPMTNTD